MVDAADSIESTQFERVLASLDPAWAKASQFFRSKGRFHAGHGDSWRLRGLPQIWKQLEARRKRFEAGDTIELLHAIALCAEENLPLPSWLALAFLERFTSTLRPGGPVTLDEAFTSQRTPKTKAKRSIQLRDWQIGGRLHCAVWKAVHHDSTITSFDVALSRALQSNPQLGMGKTKARELFIAVEHIQKRYVPTYPGLSRFLKNRRKQ